MKPHFLLFLSCLLLFATGIAQNQPKLPRPLRTPERVLKVISFPEEVKAVVETKGDSAYFVWKNVIAVQTFQESFVVEEFGYYELVKDKWTNEKSFPGIVFAELFNCPDGIMKKGVPYIQNQWSIAAPELKGKTLLWFFIGKNELENKVCGYLIVKILPQEY